MSLADYIGRYWAGAEAIYGVIIAMTFTSVLRGDPTVLGKYLGKTILSALLCCTAWGLADGIFYSWERRYLFRREGRIIEFSRSAGGQESAVSLVGEELDDTILRNIPAEHRVRLYGQLVGFLSGVKGGEKMTLRDALTIVTGTCLMSAGAGLFIVAPFFLVPDVELALRISNLAGILLLFVVGFSRAGDREFCPRVASGLGTSLIGIIIAGITIVLGG
ncbi:MAG TPA: hypothetical protein VLV30_00985 [Methanomicrobiales archaeon]|nr:hypothetical protein [Methanomicrobiales archaeon]